MAQIAYLLLCHKDPARVIAQAERLIAMGDRVAIHYDARSPAAGFDVIQSALKDEPGVAFVTPRKRCGWGEWSLVAASLAALRTARSSFPAATHFYLISGECMPTKPSAYIRRRVGEAGRDWIDATPFERSPFIKTGFREERLVYRHWFNERTQKRAFYASYHVQRVLGLRRAPPRDLTMMVGSQWWCLRRSTVDRLLDWLDGRPDVLRFFKTTWIPDEIFFQTLVRHLVPEAEIEPRTPTFVKFTDYGQPVTLHDDHLPLLKAEDCLFARKIGADAAGLSMELGTHFVSDDAVCELGQNAGRLHDFLTSLGRVGARHGGRIWDKNQALPTEMRVVLVVCKKWHLGKRLVGRIAGSGIGLGLGYAFDEDAGALPDLGGLEQGLDRRNAERLPFLNSVRAASGADVLVLGCDTSRHDVVEDLARSGARVTLIELNADLSDEYLDGHARRIGLTNAATPGAVMGDIRTTLRGQLAADRMRLRDIEGVRIVVLNEAARALENVASLGEALGLDRSSAEEVIGGSNPFQD